MSCSFVGVLKVRRNSEGKLAQLMFHELKTSRQYISHLGSLSLSVSITNIICNEDMGDEFALHLDMG